MQHFPRALPSVQRLVTLPHHVLPGGLLLGFCTHALYDICRWLRRVASCLAEQVCAQTEKASGNWCSRVCMPLRIAWPLYSVLVSLLPWPSAMALLHLALLRFVTHVGLLRWRGWRTCLQHVRLMLPAWQQALMQLA